jgi:hypothetical protein
MIEVLKVKWLVCVLVTLEFFFGCLSLDILLAAPEPLLLTFVGVGLFYCYWISPLPVLWEKLPVEFVWEDE